METGQRSGELPPLRRAVRHHLVVVLVTLLAAVGCAGLYYAVVHEDSYTSNATVLLNPVPGNPLTSESAAGSGIQLTVAMETEAGIVDTPQVAQLLTPAADVSLPREGDVLLATVPSGTQMILITYTSATAEQARMGAQQFAEAYLQYRQVKAETTQQTRLDRLREQLESWQAQLSAATAATAAAADGDALADEQVQIASLRVAELTASIGQAEVVSTAPGTVIGPAEEPQTPDGLSMALVMVAVAMAGLLCGGLLALLAEWRRDLIRADEASEIAGLPVFATLPKGTVAEVTVASEGPALEAYRRLRAGIVANCAAPHALAVSAVGVGMDASAVAANVAISLRLAGFPVVLIAASPDDSLPSILGLADGAGLAEVLADAEELENCLVDVAGVHVLGPGVVQDGRELYAGPELRGLVDTLKRTYDYVVVSAASTGTANGDSAISVADSALLAVISSVTTHTQVAAAIDRFSRLDIHPVGLVNVPTEAVTHDASTPRPELPTRLEPITPRHKAGEADRQAKAPVTAGDPESAPLTDPEGDGDEAGTTGGDGISDDVDMRATPR